MTLAHAVPALPRQGQQEWSSYIDRFTDIAFARASVTEDGQLSRSDHEYYRWPGQVWAGKVLQKAREERANPYLAVIQWDGDGRVTRLALSPEARERLAAQLGQIRSSHCFSL